MTKHIHGGDVYKHKDCLDFSANLNPLGTPESVKQAIIHRIGIRPAFSFFGQLNRPKHIFLIRHFYSFFLIPVLCLERV